MKDKGVRGSGMGDGLGKDEIKSIDDNGFRNNGRGMIVRRGVKVIFA